MVIDGFVGYPYDFGDAALITLDRDYLNDFFADASSGTIPIEDLDGLFALRFSEQRPGNRSWTEISIDVETADHRVRSAAAPWISFLNLFGGAGSFVRTVALYERSDSMTTWPPVQAVITSSPSMRPVHFGDEDEDEDEFWEHDQSLIVYNRDQFFRFLAHVHEGYRAARLVSHRADSAVRFFARAVEGYSVIDLVRDPETTQDVMIDLISALETIYLTSDDGRGKGQRIANRAAALCGDTVARQREIRRQVSTAYGHRSSVLHGDVQPADDVIARAVHQLMPVTIDSLIGFLKLHGDQHRLVQAERDVALAEQNRNAVR